MREVLERIAIAIEDNTRAVRETLEYIRKRDDEMYALCAPTYLTSAEVNRLIIEEGKAKLIFCGSLDSTKEVTSGDVMNEMWDEIIP